MKKLKDILTAEERIRLLEINPRIEKIIFGEQGANEKELREILSFLQGMVNKVPRKTRINVSTKDFEYLARVEEAITSLKVVYKATTGEDYQQPN